MVQLNVWTGTKWINVFDGNDFNNMNVDLHRVSKVVEKQVTEIGKAVKSANEAFAKAGKAVDSSNVNKEAIKSANDAIDEAKQSAQDALDKIKSLASADSVNALQKALDGANQDITGIQKSLKDTNDNVAKIQTDQTNQIKDVTDKINEAAASAKQAADSINARTDAIQVAVKNAQSDAVVATQTAKVANATAIDAKGDAANAVITAGKAAVDVKNAESDVAEIAITASGTKITAGNAKSDALNAVATASAAALTATNAQSDVAQVKVTADNLSTRMTSVEGKTAANATAIDQTSKKIALKADQTSVDKLNESLSSTNAQLQVQAGEINSKVSQEDLKKVSDKADSAIASATKNATAIDQTGKEIALKADQTTVDKIKKTATDNSAAVSLLNNEIKLKVDSTTVNQMIDDKGFATTQQAQALIDQTANKISSTITDLKTIVDKNGNLISSTNDRLTNITQSFDGLQTTVKNKADQSQVTQLADALQIKMSGSIIAQASDVTLTYTGKQNEYPPAAPLVGMNDVDKGSTLILSFDYVASADTKLTPQLDGDPWTPWGTITNATDVKKGEKGTYRAEITVNDDSWQKGDAKNVCIRCDGFKGTIEITNLVLKYADTVHDVQSTFDMLRDDINLRVTKGDLLSQINIAAGHTLIQSDKIYLDADSVVFGENSKAFIPSAYITDINADKITTGILKSIAINNGDGAFTVNPSGDVVANSITVRNGNIFQGQIIGTGFYAINRTTDTEKEVTKFTSLDQVDDSIDEWFKINGRIMEWHDGDNYASIGPAMPYLEPLGGKIVEATTSGLTMVGTNGVTISAGSKAEPGKVAPDYYIHNKQNISFALPTNIMVKDTEILVNLNPEGGNVNDNAGSQFHIWKDKKVDVYFGKGTNGNIIEFIAAGDGGAVNVRGAFNVFGAKNSAVKTSQGSVAVSAYETAEYYFGDLGTGNTGSQKRTVIGIEKLFNETVNTNIEYQVFVTPYSNARVWVSDRQPDRFIVESDVPNACFGYEIKAKRKGYENTRLAKVSE